MDIALIVFGVLALAILLIWIYSFMGDPKEINQEEEEQVRSESPHERERAAFGNAAKDEERNADDITLYSPGDGGDQ